MIEESYQKGNMKAMVHLVSVGVSQYQLLLARRIRDCPAIVIKRNQTPAELLSAMLRN